MGWNLKLLLTLHWNITKHWNKMYWSNCKWQNSLNFLQGAHWSISRRISHKEWIFMSPLYLLWLVCEKRKWSKSLYWLFFTPASNIAIEHVCSTLRNMASRLQWYWADHLNWQPHWNYIRVNVSVICQKLIINLFKSWYLCEFTCHIY